MKPKQDPSRQTAERAAAVEKQIEKVDQTLLALERRGLDPLKVLQQAVAQHDRQQCERPLG